MAKRDLGNRASPVDRAHMKRPSDKSFSPSMRGEGMRGGVDENPKKVFLKFLKRRFTVRRRNFP